MPLAAGTRLGPYEVLAPLGAGGMGEVYRARDTKLERDVAIKVLPEGLAEDPERLARFEREAKVLAALNHPNIAQIYGIEQGALVMELVEGQTLAGPLPLDTALNYGRQIADALEAAHEKAIVHRDLKPANLKVTPQGVVKVLDFGLAAVMQGPASSDGDPANSPTLTMRATQVGMILGTAAYMSPEQAAGKPVDKRADIWSFGVVLFEMLAGEKLFGGGETISHTLADVLRGPIELKRLPGETPEAIRELLRRCLDRDVKNRLRDIGEARVAIDQPRGRVPAAPAPSGGKQKRWAIGLAVMTLIAAGASFGWWRATQPVARPVMRFSVDLGPDAVAGSRTTVAISPDGTRIAYPVRGADGIQRLATRLLDQPNATPLAGTEGSADPFFSPDGQWIAFDANNKLKKIAVQGGAPVTLCDAPADRGGSWGSDGSIILAPLSAGGLVRVSSSGGTPQPLTKVGDGIATHRWPQVLPGGRAVLFTHNGSTSRFEDGSVAVLSLESGQVKTLQVGGYFGRYLPGAGGGGYLLYVHQNTLFAAPFDLNKLELRGTPSPVVEDVAGDPATGGGQFDVSQNGTLVYLSGKVTASSYPILWLDSGGKTLPLISKPGAYGAPTFSPDGKFLAHTAPGAKGAEVWVYDITRETSTQLTFTAPGNREIAWAPDGKHIVFGSSSPPEALWWIRADGSGEPQRLLEGRTVRPLSFSSDGHHLIYSENSSGLPDLWILPFDSAALDHPKPGKPEPFLRTPFVDVDAAFSPDGRWIAYSSTETEQAGGDIFVRPYPGPGGKWRISTSGGKFPIWSRAGRQLFFLGGADRIMTVDYTASGDSFVAGKPRVWSDRRVLRPADFIRDLDLAPDGRRFAVFPETETGESKGSLHTTFLLNFVDEVQQRLSAGGK